MLEVTIGRKRYGRGGAEVLRDIGFAVASGEVVGLLGRSGTGKSTTLRIVLGLDTGFEGRVRLATQRVGVMFQEPRLLPWLTVVENLRLVVLPEMPQPDLAGLLAMVQLPDSGKLYPRQLSLGMARRVALARALAVTPQLLVLDEPFASLDPGLGAQMMALVARWARERGAAVVLATHDLPQALQTVTRVLVLAGAPARLAADIPVPQPSDATVRGALQARLLGEFGFLGTGAEAAPEGRQLRSAASLA